MTQTAIASRIAAVVRPAVLYRGADARRAADEYQSEVRTQHPGSTFAVALDALTDAQWERVANRVARMI